VLEIEIDIFSGMPNPTWILSKRQEGTLYELLRAQPKQISPVAASSERLGLGYRGVIVRRIKSDDGVWEKAMSARRQPFPDEFRLGLKTVKSDSAADWLVKTAIRQGPRVVDELQEVISGGVVLVPRPSGPVDPAAKIDPKQVEEAKVAVDVPYKPGAEIHETWWACGSNYFSANAGFFNDPAHVTRNNCYCFARPARWAPGYVHDLRQRHCWFARRWLARWLPAKRLNDRDGDLAQFRLPFLSPGDRRTILVVGAQARRHAGQVHRRLRACDLPVSRPRLRPQQHLPGWLHQFLRLFLPEQLDGVRGLVCLDQRAIARGRCSCYRGALAN